MPPFTSQNIKAFVERRIHGAVSESFFDALNEGARWLLTAIDPYETKRKAFLEGALFDQINRYYLPVDVKDKKITDISKLVIADRSYSDSFTNISARTFDKYNRTGKGVGALKTYAIESIDNVKFILLQDNLADDTLTLHKADNLTDNGTWNVYGSVSNLTVDKLNFLTGKGSLRFDIDTNTSGAIEDASIVPIDLTNYMQVGAIFTWLWISNPAAMTNVTLQFGSSATDFWTFTVTAPHNNTVFTQGWNLLKFPLDGLVVFGSPNPAAIDRVRLDFQTNGSPLPQCRIDNIVARKGTIYEISYYSYFLFNDPVTGLWKPQSYSLNDNINLSTTSFNLLGLKVSSIMAQEVRNSGVDMAVLKQELEKELGNYLASNKSEFIKPMEAWYKETDPTRTQFYPSSGGIW